MFTWNCSNVFRFGFYFISLSKIFKLRERIGLYAMSRVFVSPPDVTLNLNGFGKMVSDTHTNSESGGTKLTPDTDFFRNG